MEVIVVDNASGDGTADAARSAAQSTALSVQVIEHTVNGGFADGCRIGAAAATWSLAAFPQPRHAHRPGRGQRAACLRIQSSVCGHRRWPLRARGRHDRSSFMVGST